MSLRQTKTIKKKDGEKSSLSIIFPKCFYPAIVGEIFTRSYVYLQHWQKPHNSESPEGLAIAGKHYKTPCFPSTVEEHIKNIRLCMEFRICCLLFIILENRKILRKHKEKKNEEKATNHALFIMVFFLRERKVFLARYYALYAVLRFLPLHFFTVVVYFCNLVGNFTHVQTDRTVVELFILFSRSVA